MTTRRSLWRWILGGLVLSAAILALLAWWAGEWLRGEIERRLQARLVPTVALAGPLSISVLPRPTLVLRDLVLSGEDGARLLAVRRLVVESGVDDLLASSPTIAVLHVEGLAARLLRGGDGTWNASGWMKPSAGGGGGVPLLRLERLVVDDARVRIEDAAGAALELQSLRLESGPLAWGETAAVTLGARIALEAPRTGTGEVHAEGRAAVGPSGAALEDLRVELAGALGDWVLQPSRLAVERLSVAPDDGLRGEGGHGMLQVGGPRGAGIARLAFGAASVSDGRLRLERLSVEATGDVGEAALEATLAAPAVELDGAAWRVPTAELEASAVLPGRGRVRARLPLEAKGDGAEGLVRFGPARIDLPLPGDDGRVLGLRADGDLRFGGELIAGHLAGSFDASRIAGSWRYRPGAAVPVEVEATLDRLDADRYLPKGTAEEPAPFDTWPDLPIRAELKVGRFRYRQVEGRDVRLRYDGGAASGRTPASPLPPAR